MSSVERFTIIGSPIWAAHMPSSCWKRHTRHAMGPSGKHVKNSAWKHSSRGSSDSLQAILRVSLARGAFLDYQGCSQDCLPTTPVQVILSQHHLSVCTLDHSTLHVGCLVTICYDLHPQRLPYMYILNASAWLQDGVRRQKSAEHSTWVEACEFDAHR